MKINIEDLTLVPIGGGSGNSPESVLKSVIQIGTGMFHVMAYEVAKQESGDLQGVNSVYADDLEQLQALCGGAVSTISIDNKDYVLAIFPFAR